MTARAWAFHSQNFELTMISMTIPFQKMAGVIVRWLRAWSGGSSNGINLLIQIFSDSIKFLKRLFQMFHCRILGFRKWFQNPIISPRRCSLEVWIRISVSWAPEWQNTWFQDISVSRARAEHITCNSEGLPSPSGVPFNEWQTRARDYKSSESDAVTFTTTWASLPPRAHLLLSESPPTLY